MKEERREGETDLEDLLRGKAYAREEKRAR